MISVSRGRDLKERGGLTCLPSDVALQQLHSIRTRRWPMSPELRQIAGGLCKITTGCI